MSGLTLLNIEKTKVKSPPNQGVFDRDLTEGNIFVYALLYLYFQNFATILYNF